MPLAATHDFDTATLDRTAAHLAGWSLTPGTLFAGRYRIGTLLGHGGMGEVYAAEQVAPVRRAVALKVVRGGRVSPHALARFAAERQALAAMDHPHIAALYDAGFDDAGQAYFAMEQVPGPPITAYCDRHRLTPRQRLELMVGVCEAVQHAHQRGVIHRDLKPSNILVGEYDGSPVPKVIDFGVSKAIDGAAGLTHDGCRVGTIEYMAPEQADGQPDIDTRADVYALGAVLYELLAGEPPFLRRELERAGQAEMLRILKECCPIAPSARLSSSGDLPTAASDRDTDPGRLVRQVRGELDWIALKCLEKDRARRYDSARQLAADLRRYLADRPVLAGPPSWRYRVRKFVRRHRKVTLAALLAVVGLTAGGAAATVGFVRAFTAERAKAQALADGAARAEAITEVMESALASLDPAAERSAGPALNRQIAAQLAAATKRADALAETDPLAAARARVAIGSALAALGEPARAATLLEPAVAARVAYLGTGDPATLDALARLAAARRGEGKATEAAELYAGVLAAREAADGADAPTTVRARANLAVAVHDLGRPDVTAALAESTLTAAERLFGPTDPDTLAVRGTLAAAYLELGRPADAARLGEETLRRRESTLGADHPDTLRAMNDLGVAYRALGRPGDAARMHTRALGGRVGKLGADHPDTLASRGNLAAALLALGDFTEAARIEEETLARRKAVLGPTHPDALASMSNLAVVRRAQGKPAEAATLQEEVLAARRNTLGTDHPDTLTAANNLAVSFVDLGRVADAIVLHTDTLRRASATLGDDHPTTKGIRANLTAAERAAK